MPKINNVTNKKIMEKLLKIEKEMKDFNIIKNQIDKIIIDCSESEYDSGSDIDSESESESDTDSEYSDSESESDTESDSGSESD